MSEQPGAICPMCRGLEHATAVGTFCRQIWNGAPCRGTYVALDETHDELNEQNIALIASHLMSGKITGKQADELMTMTDAEVRERLDQTAAKRELARQKSLVEAQDRRERNAAAIRQAGSYWGADIQ